MNSEDLKNYIKERLNNTFAITFIFSMGFHYWKIILILFSTEIFVKDKIKEIEILLNYDSKFGEYVFYSFCTSIIVSILIAVSKRISVFLNTWLDIKTINTISKYKERNDTSILRVFALSAYISQKIDKDLSDIITKLFNTKIQPTPPGRLIKEDDLKVIADLIAEARQKLDKIIQAYIRNNPSLIKNTYIDLNSKYNDFEQFENSKITPEINDE